MPAVTDIFEHLRYEVYKQDGVMGEVYGVEALWSGRLAFDQLFESREAAAEAARLLNVNRVTVHQAPYVIEDFIYERKHR